MVKVVGDEVVVILIGGVVVWEVLDGFCTVVVVIVDGAAVECFCVVVLLTIVGNAVVRIVDDVVDDSFVFVTVILVCDVVA